MVVFKAPDGWPAEIVDLDLTRPPKSRMDPAGDGAQFLVRRYSRLIAVIRTLEELGELFDVSSLQREDSP